MSASFTRNKGGELRAVSLTVASREEIIANTITNTSVYVCASTFYIRVFFYFLQNGEEIRTNFNELIIIIIVW